MNIGYNIVITERMPLSIDFKSIFTSISLNVLNIELKKDLNTDKSENFNTDI